MFETNFIAWWGATVATIVLAWDIVKWLKSGPQIRSRIQLNTMYPDGKRRKVENPENIELEELAAYCHIELVNIGNLPTTVMGISASHLNQTKQGLMSYSGSSFTPHYGKTLPHVISPGEVWSCRFDMSGLFELSKLGRPYIAVYLSHKKKPLIIKPKLSTNQS